MFTIPEPENPLALQELRIMKNHVTSALDVLKDQSLSAYNLFWKGETSPSEKMALLGTQALAVFTLNSQTQDFLKLVDPTHEILGVPEGYSIAWNEDGSGVITEPE